MERKNKVSVVILLGVIFLAGLLVGSYVFKSSNSEVRKLEKQYQENIQSLNETIKELKNDIARYQQEIERIDIERESIHKELNQIMKDYEETDGHLVSGDWDDNVRFFTRFISEGDNLGKRHGDGHNETSAD